MIQDFIFVCECGRWFKDGKWRDTDILEKIYIYRLTLLKPLYKKVVGEMCDQCCGNVSQP